MRMSIAYHIDHERGLALVLWNGVVTAAEFLAHARWLVADPAWPPSGGRHLTDLRSATLHPSIDDGVLREAADIFGAHPRIAGLRHAIVAGDAFVKADAFERLIRRYGLFAFVFNSLNPACAWLGIDATDAGRILQSLRTQARPGNATLG
jgi:hypothetical protein